MFTRISFSLSFFALLSMVTFVYFAVANTISIIFFLPFASFLLIPYYIRLSGVFSRFGLRADVSPQEVVAGLKKFGVDDRYK